MTGIDSFRRSSARYVASTGAVAAMAMACSGKSADLGSSLNIHPVYSNEAPAAYWDGQTVGPNQLWKMVEDDARIFQFSVLNGNAYWLTQLNFTTYEVGPWRCSIAGCEQSAVGGVGLPSEAFGGGNSSYIRSLAVDDNALLLPYWSRQPYPSHEPMTVITTPGDCYEPSLVKDGLLILSGPKKLCSCDPARCGETLLSLYDYPPGTPESVMYPRRLAMDTEYLYVGDGRGVSRLRLDGAAEPEMIAAGEQNIGGLAVQGDIIYWTESVTLGKVKSCPKSGCLGEPRQLMTNLMHPVSVIADEEFVYVNEPCSASVDSEPPRDRILRCRVDGCAQPTLVAEGVGSMSDLSQDAEQIYFAGSASCGYDYRLFDYYIAAIPKHEKP